MRGLSARILALSLGLVLLTAVAAALATVQFARASARTEQRAELQAQASLVTLQSGRLVTPRALRRIGPGLDGSVLTVFDGATGAVLASTAPGRTALLTATAGPATQAAAGRSVSSSIRVGTRELLLEARPTADGGAIVLTRPLTPLTRAATDLVSRILVVLLAASAVAAAAAAWLSRRIARPLAQVAAAAGRLARGERGVEVPSDAPAEVHDVAEALRALDSALAVSEGRQREFLLSVSHELRTPLTALQGYGEALADGVISGDLVREAGVVLTAETARIERFTADLLELARLEADDFSITASAMDLAETARAAIAAWSARAAALDVALRADGLEAPLPVEADPRRARQVLDGLLENAVRATPAGGAVTLVGVRAAGRGGIAVEDTGPGLSDDDLANAFTRGLLRERYRESRPVGTGLGLSIATRLAARMGGTVTAGHASAGPGARFALELPAR